MAESKANAEVFPETLTRVPSLLKRALIALAIVAGAAGLVGGALAYLTYDFARDHEGRILPGASIEGVDVSGMTKREAVRAVRTAVLPSLKEPVTLTFRGREWTTSARELGAHANVEAKVVAALGAAEEVSGLDLMRMRLFDQDFDHDSTVHVRYPRQKAAALVAEIADKVDREPVDAHIDSSSGWVKIVPERNGLELRQGPTTDALMKAFKRGTPTVPVVTVPLKPEVTSAAFEKVLLVHIGENKLYYYEDGKIVHEWPVATGQPEFPTPTGIFAVSEKRYMPTWINPDPTGWGAGMPESIPPGPSNPLGMRAINWGGTLIRFHGTTATYSLGYNASHGCVRMSNEDVIQLYDLVDVGTPIVSVNYGTMKPLYGSSAPTEGG